MEDETNTENSNSIRKRSYSRKGCNECKKRKLKCDETKPCCLKCSKSLKVCSYKQIAKFCDSRTATLGNILLTKQNKIFKNSCSNLSPSVDLTKVDNRKENKAQAIQLNKDNRDVLRHDTSKSKVFPCIHKDDEFLIKHRKPKYSAINEPKISNESPSEVIIQESTTPGSLNRILDKYNRHDQTLLNDASSLTHGLNDIAIIDMLDEMPNVMDEIKHKSSIGMNRAQSNLIKDADSKINNLILFYDLNADHKNYLSLFYNKYSIWLMPFSSGTKNICNETLMNLALEFPFLLNAIFSITARYENFCVSNSVDEYYQKYYFIMCCKGFASMFEDKTQISKYIEPLILTTLILVTDAVAFVNGDWRSHLKVAHNLFSKYVSIYKRTSNSILLSTIWFAALEILAVVSNPLGGAINSQAEFDTMMSAGVNLKDNSLSIQLGLTLPNGYNVFLGYSEEAVTMFTTFVRITLRMKENSIHRVSSDDLTSLFCKIKDADRYYLASHDCVISQDNPYHPNNKAGMLLPIATYGYNNNIIFSWFDISHKLHVHALYLKILTDKHFLNLPEDSPLVHDVVKKILGLCHFFQGIDFESTSFTIAEQLEENKNTPLWLDRRLLTVHWPLLTCGLCCVDKLERLKIKLYFKSLIQMGARSLERSLKNVENKWSGGSGISDYVPFV